MYRKSIYIYIYVILKNIYHTTTMLSTKRKKPKNSNTFKLILFPQIIDQLISTAPFVQINAEHREKLAHVSRRDSNQFFLPSSLSSLSGYFGSHFWKLLDLCRAAPPYSKNPPLPTPLIYNPLLSSAQLNHIHIFFKAWLNLIIRLTSSLPFKWWSAEFWGFVQEGEPITAWAQKAEDFRISTK